jgi:hypothetical protein
VRTGPLLAAGVLEPGAAGGARNTRWHLIHDVPAAKNVTPLLDVIDDPGRPPFLG